MTNKVLDIYNTVAYGNDIDPLSGDLNKEQDRKKIERYLYLTCIIVEKIMNLIM